MQSLEPIYIAGSSIGLENDKKPFLIPDQAFQYLQNAYVWRDRVKKRLGNRNLGRLRRILIGQNLGNTDGSGNFSGNIGVILGLESTSQIVPGSITVTVGAQNFTEPASQNGTLSNGGSGTGTINYNTGALTINTDPDLAATPVTINFSYYPGLPVMGIWQQEIANDNNEVTIIWDTKYAYRFLGTGFQEYIAGTTWDGNNTNFFLATNYRGATASDRLFFVTNFSPTAGSPMRYTDSTAAAWTTFQPIIADNPPSAAQSLLFQAKILIPYYGRLLALNTYEGTTAGGIAAASNFYNRCRFSQIGSPIATDAWRTDIFGKGGFIDAPVNERIISATFFKNTLVVGFERSTWQLRYVGEYGLPFLWERISSDFGTESQFSAVLFDQGVSSFGDRAIVSSDATTVRRIDEKIPDVVFSVENDEADSKGLNRVVGIRDFQKELVFWTYPNSIIQDTSSATYPNSVLVYNYRNGTWAQFRDNVTFFGIFQSPTGISWSSTDVFWDNMEVFWIDAISQSEFPSIISGNQQGWVHYYGYKTQDDPSLQISSCDLTTTPIQITVRNHNIYNDEIVYLTGLQFVSNVGVAVTTDLNNTIFLAKALDANTLELYKWNGTQYVNNFSFTPATTSVLIRGNLTLFPLLYVQTKDFNPYQSIGIQPKLSYIDFLTDSTPNSAMSVQLYLNSSLGVQGNVIVGNQSVETALNQFGSITGATQTNPCQITSPNHGLQTGAQIQITNVLGMTELNGINYTITYIDEDTFSLDGIDATAFTTYISGGQWTGLTFPFFLPECDYCWHRFYATTTGQFISIAMTYNDELMNLLSTHQQSWVLNAIAIWIRKGSRNVF